MTTIVDVLDGTLTWYRVVDSGHPAEGDRLHARIAGRYITIFRHKGVLSAIDALCHHAGGPLTLGKVVDIEDLGVTVVQCPWHKWSVTIDTGMKAYQGVEIKNGKPCPTGWRMGKLVQRAHKVVEHEDGIYVSLVFEDDCASDRDACAEPLAKDYRLSADVSEPLSL